MQNTKIRLGYLNHNSFVVSAEQQVFSWTRHPQSLMMISNAVNLPGNTMKGCLLSLPILEETSCPGSLYTWLLNVQERQLTLFSRPLQCAQ